MDANDFLEVVTDPNEWTSKARALRNSASVLFELFETAFARMEEEGFSQPEEDEALEFLRTAQMLYGLVVENALKATLIRQHPEKIRLEVETNGRGEAERAVLRFDKIGGHDLVGLAKASDVFAESGSFYKPHKDLKAVLRMLSERVRWSGRYPTPSKSGENYEWKKHVPLIRFSSGFREVIDPLLDAYLS